MPDPRPKDRTHADDTVDSLDRAFEDIKTEADKLAQKFNKIAKHVEDVWDDIPQSKKSDVTTDTTKIRNEISKYLTRVERAFKHQAPVISLIYTSFDWLTYVQQPVSNLEGELKTAADHDELKWTSDAAVVYREIRSRQADAVKAAAGNAGAMSTWLDNIAKANVNYAVQVASGIVQILGKLVEAGIEALTGLGLAEAIGSLAEAIALAVTEAVELLLGIAERLVAAISDTRTLYAIETDNGTFTDGAWPEAVTL